MPIKLVPFASKACEFSEWSIKTSQRSRLIEIIAFLYLRQEQNALRVITALAPKKQSSPGRVAANVIKKLTAPDLEDLKLSKSTDPKIKKKAEDRIRTSIIHRDGLLFQHISWVVTKKAFPNGIMTSPHVRKADKGFDGFVMELDEFYESIESVTLCEDKASEDPRKLITQSVWPEIEAIIAGERDDEVLAELVTLLKTVPSLDAESAVESMFWEESRQFRVSVATSEKTRDKTSGSYVKIMKGFEEKVGGASKNRVGGVLAFDDVRTGLDQLANEVIKKVKELTDV